MDIIMKYNQGVKHEDVIHLEVDEKEFSTMIEFDYQERLLLAKEGEVISRRTPQEIIDEMNKNENNSYRRHYRNAYGRSNLDDTTGEEIKDDSDIIFRDSEEDYVELCETIKKLLKPAQADMIIAICLNGVKVKDYASQLGEKVTAVSNRFVRAKKILKEKMNLE